MYDFGYQKDRMDDIIPPDVLERRNGMEDRRQTPASGFAYVSTVGWICRREQSRRSEDPPIDCGS